ncbi:MAG: hypothetical protein M3450_13535, partial [Actinomycetota bacterium]|nr:hypothetical protein [Actinomycetota bacterium]
AAWRLERLGYGPVYDYVAGKVDWIAAGLPTVRADGAQRRAIDAADCHPPTTAPDHRLDTLTPAEGRGVIVANEQGVVLGRIPPTRLGDAGDLLAEAVMDVGPTTVRAHEPLDPLLERMGTRNVNEMLVTTPEGELLGVVYRSHSEP